MCIQEMNWRTGYLSTGLGRDLEGGFERSPLLSGQDGAGPFRPLVVQTAAPVMLAGCLPASILLFLILLVFLVIFIILTFTCISGVSQLRM